MQYLAVARSVAIITLLPLSLSFSRGRACDAIDRRRRFHAFRNSGLHCLSGLKSRLLPFIDLCKRERERQLSRYLGDYRYTHKSCEKSGLGVGWCSLHGSAARILSNVADDAAAAAVRWLLIAAINRAGGYYGIAGTWGIYIRCWWRKGVDACGMVEWSERLGLICSLSLFLGYGRKNVYTRVSRDCAGNQW